jgi:hypothetical protein
MDRQINLLGQQVQKKVSAVYSVPLFGGSIVLFIVLVAATIGITVWGYTLTKQKDTLASNIAQLEGEVASLKEVEDKKSVVTIKVDEIERLYNGRLDYVKAIDDVQKLFSYTLDIETIELKDDKTAIVQANKIGDIVISESQALTTDIVELTLELQHPSSLELQETVDNLRAYLGRGLSSADVKQSFKLEEEEGYQVDFTLTFGQAATGQPALEGAIENGQL